MKRIKKPTSVMVFAAVATNGSVMPPIFIPSEITVTSKSYQELVLSKVKEWMLEQFGPFTGFRGQSDMGGAVLMQDGVPAHTSNSTQAWLTDNVERNNFWGKLEWPLSSPDCNPLDFSLWNQQLDQCPRTRRS